MKGKFNYSFTILFFVLFFLFGTFASTTIASGKDKYFIQKFDKDKDGKLSKEEYFGSDASFKKWDKNNDGYIDESEVPKSSLPESQKKKKRGGGYIQNYDKDKDGKLSRQEYPGSDASFKNWDKNEDGYIDESETRKSPLPGSQKMEKRGSGYIQKFDKDKDGKLSRQEYPGSDTAFKNWDENDDGYIDENEAHKGPSTERSRGGGRDNKYIQNFDKDKDGKLSRQEYPGSDNTFKKLDKNNDGYLDENEIRHDFPPGRMRKDESNIGFIDKHDKDKDGKVSKLEYPGSDAAFKRLDKNGDGYIDRDEIYQGRPAEKAQPRI